MPVTDTHPNPSGHASLYDGTTTVNFVLVDGLGNIDPKAVRRRAQNRTSLKGSEGGGTYADFEPPYIPVVQNDWSGGRGQEDFERDRSRFFDSYRLNTWMSNQVILGPQEQWTTGYRIIDQVMPGSITWTSLLSGTRYLAVSFGVVTGARDRAYLWVRRVGTPGDIVVELNDDSSGDPGTARETVTVTPSTFGSDTASVFYSFDWSGTNTLTAGSTFWIKIYAASADSTANHWEVGTSSTVGTTEDSSDNSSWSAASVGLYFRMVDTDDDREHIIYSYKQGLYMVSKPTDGSAAQWWINGDRGTADSNSGALSTLIDGTKSWNTNEFTNSVVILTAGTGSEEITPFRVISTNTGTELTVSPDWNITHDTTTEYVIVADDIWIEIAGHGLTAPVTDVLASKDVTYFAQGDSTNIRRFQGATSAGTWTRSYADDGSNQGTFLELVEDPVDGQQVWKGSNSLSSEVAVERATAQAWGTDLTFGTDIVVGTRDDKITGMDKYGSPEVLWVLKEASQWAVQNDIPDQIPLREMASVQSTKNGKGHLVHGVYLYFSLLHSLERYFRNNLDDVGPSLDFGLPADRQGPIVDMVGYPGIFFAAIDGDTSNYSSILVSSGSRDWHELYRAPQTGQRIRNLYFQVIPGSTVDRLWFSQGTDVLWLPFPSDTLDPFRDSNYLFTHEGHLVTSWMYADLQDVQKLFKSMKVFAENLSSSAQVIQADYQTDGDTETSTWNNLNGTFDTVPVEEIDLVSDPVASGVTGRRVRFRFRFETNSNTSTPRMKATVAEMLGSVAQKYSYSFSFQVEDFEKDLLGIRSGDRAETKATQLETWATNPTALTFRSERSPFDSKTVKLTSLELDPLEVDPSGQLEKLTGSLTVVEI